MRICKECMKIYDEPAVETEDGVDYEVCPYCGEEATGHVSEDQE